MSTTVQPTALSGSVSPAEEMTARIRAALPDVIDQAMKNALPERHTPELAAQFAKTMTVFLDEHIPPAGHYPWCQPGACSQESDGTWSEHIGRTYATTVDGYRGNTALQITAQLGYIDDFDFAPTVLLRAGEDNEAFLDGPAVDQAILQLSGLVGLLKALRHQMTAERAEATA